MVQPDLNLTRTGALNGLMAGPALKTMDVVTGEACDLCYGDTCINKNSSLFLSGNRSLCIVVAIYSNLNVV